MNLQKTLLLLVCIVCARGAAAEEASPRDVAALRAAFATADDKDKVAAASELLAEDANSASMVIAFLHNRFKHRKTGTFQFLAAIKPAAKNAVPELIKHLSDEDSSLRHFAMEGLKDNYEFSRAALESLLEAESAELRLAAARTLARAYAQAAPSISRLMELLDDPDNQIQCEAALAVLDIQSDQAAAVMPTIVELFDSLEGDQQLHVLEHTRRRGVPLSLAKPLLLLALKGDKHFIRFEAAIRLVDNDVELPMQLVPILREHLKLDGRVDRSDAVRALGSIGVDAKDAIPQLKEFLSQEDRYLKEDAALAIALIDSSQLDAMLPQILAAFDDLEGYSRERLWYIDGLAKLTSAAKPTASLMRKMLDRDDEPLRVSLAVVMLKIDGGHREDALAAIRGYFQGDKLSYVPIDAFEGVGEAAAPLIPDLERVLETPEHPERRNAILLLRGIGSKGRPLLQKHGL